MKTIDFSYFIERYNAYEMNEAERIWFEKELANNEDLRKETELRRKTDKILEDQSVLTLRSKLNVIQDARSLKEPVKKLSSFTVLRYAAIFTGILIIGSLLLYNQKPLTADEIFNDYYTPYPAQHPVRGVMDAVNTDYEKAIEFYNVHDYRNAAQYFRKVLTDNPRDYESTMLYGFSNMEESNYPEAERSFIKVRENDNNPFVEDAEWYLGLCYLKTDDEAKAVSIFSMIKQSNSMYRKNAGKILKRLK